MFQNVRYGESLYRTAVGLASGLGAVAIQAATEPKRSSSAGFWMNVAVALAMLFALLAIHPPGNGGILFNVGDEGDIGVQARVDSRGTSGGSAGVREGRGYRNPSTGSAQACAESLPNAVPGTTASGGFGPVPPCFMCVWLYPRIKSGANLMLPSPQPSPARGEGVNCQQPPRYSGLWFSSVMVRVTVAPFS